jgi:hypothetical protein
MRTTEEGKSSDPNIKDNLLIYPTLSPKSDSGEPFSTILKEFKTKMMDDVDVCIVIGFSFRDGYINEVFKDFANKDTRGKTRKIIVISPSAGQNFFKNIVGNENQPQADNAVYDTIYEKAGLTIVNKGIDTTRIREIVDDINDNLKS